MVLLEVELILTFRGGVETVIGGDDDPVVIIGEEKKIGDQLECVHRAQLEAVGQSVQDVAFAAGKGDLSDCALDRDEGPFCFARVEVEEPDLAAIAEQEAVALCERNGEVFESLSALVTKVTGTRWNGFQFFGLTKKGGANG